jgi:dsDNA-binding SOS-regulon protein
MPCSINWCAFTWEAFATILTGVSAVAGAVWVARGQMKIQNKQTHIQAYALRSDLFDRRYKIFDETRKFLTNIPPSRESDYHDAKSQFQAAREEALLLFDNNVLDGLQEIWKQFLIFEDYRGTDTPTDSSSNDGDQERQDARLWLLKRKDSLPELFHSMKLDDKPLN